MEIDAKAIPVEFTDQIQSKPAGICSSRSLQDEGPSLGSLRQNLSPHVILHPEIRLCHE